MADKLDTSAPAFSQEGPATMSDRNFKEAIELLAERDKEIAKLCNQIQEVLYCYISVTCTILYCMYVLCIFEYCNI